MANRNRDGLRERLLVAALAFPLAGIIGFTGNVVIRKALSPAASEVAPPAPASDDADRPAPSRIE